MLLESTKKNFHDVNYDVGRLFMPNRLSREGQKNEEIVQANEEFIHLILRLTIMNL